MTDKIKELIENLKSRNSPYLHRSAETELLSMCKPLMDVYLNTCEEFGFCDYERCSTSVISNLRKPYAVRCRTGFSKTPILSIISEAENPNNEEGFFYMPIQWLELSNPEKAIREIAKNTIRNQLIEERSRLYGKLNEIDGKIKKLDEDCKDE